MNECVAAATDNCFIKDAASDTYTPVADDVMETVVAVALYTDGRPNAVADAKDFAMMVTAQPVLADTRNKAPVFADQDEEMEGEQTDQERSVFENVPATMAVRPVGAVVTAMDFIINPLTGDPTLEILTYTLGGPDADSFTINRGTAQISTKADVALDTETKDTYTVTVDGDGPVRADGDHHGDHHGNRGGRSAGDHGRRAGHIRYNKSRLRRGQAGRRGQPTWRQGRNRLTPGGRLRATTPATSRLSAGCSPSGVCPTTRTRWIRAWTTCTW